jgi:hypothetical protein
VADPCRIPLGRGLFALVDAEDFDQVQGYEWRAEERKGKTYVRAMVTLVRGRNGRRVPVYMHRVVTGAPPRTPVDHVNHDGLDNRRSNLRICDQRQNSQHMRRTGLKGLKWIARVGLWQGRIAAPPASGVGFGVERYLGLFAEREWAARAYDVAALELFGAFAQTNFDPSQYTPALRAEIDRRRVRGGNLDRGKFRGVWPHGHKWGASIGGSGREYLGLFGTPEAAARAYDEAAIRKFGARAVTNFPAANDSTAAASGGGR